MAADPKAAENAIFQFLSALGFDPNANPDLAGTPQRVVEAFTTDLLSGYGVDVAALLAGESTPVASDETHGLVSVKNLSTATVCPHHLLVGLGRATVAYLPGRAVVGIGTLSRLVDAYARRLTLQESIGENVVRALVDHAGARGALCRLEFRHTCLAARGTRQADASVLTVARAGEPLDEAALFGAEGP